MQTLPFSPDARFAIGQQSFKVLREGGAVYIDKTQYIRRLLESQSKYFFLARPRRFGKSLFLSALKFFFLGERNLFKNLYIDSSDWEWKKYPVLHLDLNAMRYGDITELDVLLDDLFRSWENEYGIKKKSDNQNVRFKNIIEGAHAATGLPVVILVDEYDKPLVGNLNNSELFEHYREKLASIYANFKNCADHIKMVFLTGVSRFSKLTIFSGLNNLRDITFENTFADVCGISEEEIERYLLPAVDRLAKSSGLTLEETRLKLKRNYNGYRFTKAGSEMYNPWSLTNALEKEDIQNYWNQTGIPTLVAESLKRIDTNLKEFLNSECSAAELFGLDLLSSNPLALLYQTGYLTIKDYDADLDEYTVGIPNREVEAGLFDVLLPFYSSINNYGQSSITTVNKFVKALRKGDAETFMKELQTFFASIPYDLNLDNERNLQNALFVFMSLLGLKTQAETHTSDGRIDLLVMTDKFVYIIELKYDATAEEALAQIEEKQYHLPWATDSRKTILIGAAFSSETRRVDSWIIKY